MHDRVEFPLELDLRPLQGVGIDLEADDPAPVYELASILVHKGASAFHGHYGAWLVTVVCWFV